MRNSSLVIAAVALLALSVSGGASAGGLVLPSGKTVVPTSTLVLPNATPVTPAAATPAPVLAIKTPAPAAAVTNIPMAAGAVGKNTSVTLPRLTVR